MNVALYARFSSAKQNETSIEAQLLEAEEFCRRNNYNVVKIYKDEAKSAKTANRPQFQKMIRDSSEHLFQAIIVYQLDRFARSRYDSVLYKDKLRKNGVRVLSVRECITDDASGIVVEGLLEAMGEYYSVELAQKVNRNMRLNAQQGFFNGGSLTLGFKLEPVKVGTKTKKKFAINEKTAPIIKESFELKDNDIPNVEIVELINSKGYRTDNGEKITVRHLEKIFRNPRYIGTNFYGDEEFPDTIPAIIDKDLYYRVQKKIDQNMHSPAKAKAKEEYILTNKLFCGNCKEAMVGTCGRSKTGKVYHYYFCKGAKKKVCNKKNVKKKESKT